MKIKLLFFFLAIATFGLTSCGGDDDVDCTGNIDLGIELADELTAVNEAAQAYLNDPSSDNCEDYVKALEDYVDALADWEDCADQAGVLAEFQQDLQDAQDAIAAIQC